MSKSSELSSLRRRRPDGYGMVLRERIEEGVNDTEDWDWVLMGLSEGRRGVETNHKRSPFSILNFFDAMQQQNLNMNNNDPRDPSLEITFTIPQTWSAQDNVGSYLF
jgi:hypothetical protein